MSTDDPRTSIVAFYDAMRAREREIREDRLMNGTTSLDPSPAHQAFADMAGEMGRSFAEDSDRRSMLAANPVVATKGGRPIRAGEVYFDMPPSLKLQPIIVRPFRAPSSLVVELALETR